MHSVPTLNIPLQRDLRQVGMSDQEVCAWAYFAAIQRRCEQICIIYPGGWEKTYTMNEVRALLMNTPSLHPEVRMGARRDTTLRQRGSE
jgi:hypothetical protein